MPAVHHAHWRTAATPDGGTPDGAAAAREAGALGEHLRGCHHGARGTFTLRCAADALHRFVSARFASSLALAVALLGLCVFG
jgi:hypothetical protein